MAALAQTVTIVNKSGKVVKTSKHLANVFNEAKSAYAEKKAEIKAMRRADADDKEAKARQKLENMRLDDDLISQRSSRPSSEDGRSSVRRKPVPSRRPPVERGYSDSFYANDSTAQRRSSRSHRPSPLRFDSHGDCEDDPRAGELVRRATDGMERNRPRTPIAKRSSTLDSIDMDLAYGELPPPLPDTSREAEVELRSKVTALQRMLDEANCMQHSVTAMIDNLQKNPDALAAVALTLAEISNLAAKLAPGALASLKGSFPAVLALLASPQFAIAAGVGVGVTIIAFGGYKIIKKIKQRKERADSLLEYPEGGDGARTPDSDGMEELRELDGVDLWRRGVADEAAESVGTSVEGEFITPTATRTLIEQGRLRESDLKSNVTSKTKKSGRTHKSEKTHRRRSKSEASSKAKSGSSSSEKVKGEKKKKESGGIRMLFKTHD